MDRSTPNQDKDRKHCLKIARRGQKGSDLYKLTTLMKSANKRLWHPLLESNILAPITINSLSKLKSKLSFVNFKDPLSLTVK